MRCISTSDGCRCCLLYCPHLSHSLKLHYLASAEKISLKREDDLGFLCVMQGLSRRLRSELSSETRKVLRNCLALKLNDGELKFGFMDNVQSIKPVNKAFILKMPRVLLQVVICRQFAGTIKICPHSQTNVSWQF